MMIKAVCSVHPTHSVYLLEATTKYWYDDVANQVKLPIAERSERASYVELDEANLYCTADDPFNHDVYFKIIDDGRGDN